jgi:hypothetical protein
VADEREIILSRLVALCGEVDGVQAVVRNTLDVAALARPAVVIHDGTELLASAPDDIRARNSSVQIMEMSPLLMVIVRGGGAADPGVIMSLYRSQIVAGILRDSAILAAIGTNGRVRYEGCAVAVPDAEAQEHRIELSLTFRYPFRLDDL